MKEQIPIVFGRIVNDVLIRASIEVADIHRRFNLFDFLVAFHNSFKVIVVEMIHVTIVTLLFVNDCFVVEEYEPNA